MPGKGNKLTGRKTPLVRAQKKKKNNGGTVRAPVAQNRSSAQQGSQKSHIERGTARIGTVNGAVDWTTVVNIPIQPGLSSSFGAWIAQMSGLYDRYLVRGLTVRYKNIKGTGADGNITMSFDRNVTDAAPTSAQAARESTASNDGSPWRIFEMKVPIRDPKKLFVRSGNTPPGEDPKTYDFGSIFVGVEGCADTSIHGYLECDYVLEFFDRTAAESAVQAIVQDTSVYTMSSDQVFYDVAPVNMDLETVLLQGSHTSVAYIVAPAVPSIDIHTTGLYKLSLQLRVDPGASAAEISRLAPFRNGIEQSSAMFWVDNSAVADIVQGTSISPYAVLQLDAGDYVDIRLIAAAATTTTVSDNGTFLEVQYLGNSVTAPPQPLLNEKQKESRWMQKHISATDSKHGRTYSQVARSDSNSIAPTEGRDGVIVESFPLLPSVLRHREEIRSARDEIRTLMSKWEEQDE